MTRIKTKAPTTAACLTRIAQVHLGLETLEERRSDSLDFHEVSVWSVRDALRAAFEAGQAAAREA
ncbi:hypothetical protein IQ03_05167 [Gemmobacter caeni]|uniref:DUF6900 domain-containing protein n=1 Tax=Gemmobacter caeni TaxID=589035 RepID=A0A2T6A224_9RHOB|nr:hypothetical protein [Gemmobacter caeni]PTX37870.1 hypothetical protein C8N34_1472 [Gemmobacter caeni]TWI89814.1 hypothetical protein IQ03_05167 [Gemmobacter caeni]